MKYFSLFSGIGGFEKGIQQAYEDKRIKKQNQISQRRQEEIRNTRNGYNETRGDLRYSGQSSQECIGFSEINKFEKGIEQTNQGGKCKSKPKRSIGRSLSRKGSIRGSNGRRRQPKQISTKRHRLQHGECVGYSEIDKYAIQIYKGHYPNHKNYGDATTINVKKLPDFDLLCAGFPCQAFSVAGKRRGFKDTRGTLFFEIVRICKEKKPQYILLENVKGLLSHEGGRTFQTIIRVLTNIGYRIEWQVLNSKDFGVPQNRERVFIVGHLGGKSRFKVFPLRKDDKGNIQTQKESQRKETRIRGDCASVDARTGSTARGQHLIAKGGQGAKTGLYQTSPCIRAEHHNTSDVHFIGNMPKIRRLIPLECERLQGFPDNWTKYGMNESGQVEISDTQRYKCLGNAVTVNVVEAIIKNLTKSMKSL